MRIGVAAVIIYIVLNVDLSSRQAAAREPGGAGVPDCQRLRPPDRAPAAWRAATRSAVGACKDQGVAQLAHAGNYSPVARRRRAPV